MRPDILSKIALEDAFWDTGASRLKLMLQSTGGLRLGIYTLALISLAGLGWSAMQMLVRRSGKRSDANKHLAAMRSAACHNDTLELYRLLKAPESPLFFGDAHHKLMRSIENTLFTTNQLPDRVNPPVNVDIELKRIKKIIGQTGYSPETPRNQALAEI